VKENLFILFLEDDAADYLLINRELHRSGLVFESKQVETKDAFLKGLQEHPPDLILCDHGLHDFDSFSALALARQQAPKVPFIIVTGSLSEEAVIRATKFGATNCVPKHRLADLVPAVYRALEQAEARSTTPVAADERCRRLEEQLARQNAQLEAVNHELETFSYSVSHDLRAPLRHIDGFADLLRQGLGGKLDPANEEYLRIISLSTRQMSKLIDALVAYSRIARAPMQRAWVKMEILLRGALHDLRYDVEGRKIEWVIGELPEAFGDATLLRQALLNLISNALKYTRPRELARIEIGYTSTSTETVFFVRDNGIGFDMRYAEKLFGVFQRLHGSAEFEGVGIGLANVRRIIQRHGGRSWAEAAPNCGATFYFSLPKADQPGLS
jgi:signal transduction histidine kinase